VETCHGGRRLDHDGSEITASVCVLWFNENRFLGALDDRAPRQIEEVYTSNSKA
jgi:hypothetical protein